MIYSLSACYYKSDKHSTQEDDAARYRWLREDENRMVYHSAFTGDQLDNAIDHAMRINYGK